MKHLIKMIVSDLDGTLLRTDKTISGQTKTILSECKKSGIKLAYATARGASAEHITSAIPFDGKITMGGATAKVDDKVIYKCLIPNLISRPLLVACNKYGLKVTSEIDGMHYTNYDVSGYEWVDDSYITVDFNHHSKDAEKIFLVGLTSEAESFVKSQLPDSLYMVMAVADDVDGFGMIMHKDATKSKAIATLASVWGIDQSEIAAFGNDLNDLDMLSYAGIGVAMENALDEVKAVADYICLSNDEDGVAKWITSNWSHFATV